ncbi:hypothetical protein [Streptomyces sp. 058-1L]|uniref:hypothetical protein n=1 Tax=Streptomyces sp. 058-1L TaxID=2789266 RepID=UPI00397F0A7F
MRGLPRGRRLFEALRSALVAASAEAALPVESLWAVTVGTPGVIDRGEILLAPSIPEWAGLPVQRMSSRWLDAPFISTTMSTSLCCASDGAAPNADDLVFAQRG